MALLNYKSQLAARFSMCCTGKRFTPLDFSCESDDDDDDDDDDYDDDDDDDKIMTIGKMIILMNILTFLILYTTKNYTSLSLPPSHRFLHSI